jgi:hypothetical protein
MLHAEFGGMGGILRMSRTPGREKQDEDRDETFGSNLHSGSLAGG